jgi:hypothetical protein
MGFKQAFFKHIQSMLAKKKPIVGELLVSCISARDAIFESREQNDCE